MKDDEQIIKRIKEIEEDDRYQSGLEHPATIDINAPLALIQMGFESEIRALKWVLKGMRKTKKQTVSAGYHRPVCPKCNCELHPETNGVGVLDVTDNGAYELWDADKWKCPKCGLEVVGGLGDGCISAHYKDDFVQMIDSYVRKGKLIKNTG